MESKYKNMRFYSVLFASHEPSDANTTVALFLLLVAFLSSFLCLVRMLELSSTTNTVSQFYLSHWMMIWCTRKKISQQWATKNRSASNILFCLALSCTIKSCRAKFRSAQTQILEDYCFEFSINEKIRIHRERLSFSASTVHKTDRLCACVWGASLRRNMLNSFFSNSVDSSSTFHIPHTWCIQWRRVHFQNCLKWSRIRSICKTFHAIQENQSTTMDLVLTVVFAQWNLNWNFSNV